VASGRADRDPTGDLKGALAPTKTRNFAAITEPHRIGELLRAIDGYQGEPAMMAALKLAPLVFVRPGELRGAEWSEIDLEAAEWRIAAARMKMGREHIVPLSSQAVAILEEIKPLTGQGRLVFPSPRSKSRPMSENTLNAALRRMGYSAEEMTAHGFRTMASTRLNEIGWQPDVIGQRQRIADGGHQRRMVEPDIERDKKGNPRQMQRTCLAVPERKQVELCSTH